MNRVKVSFDLDDDQYQLLRQRREGMASQLRRFVRESLEREGQTDPVTSRFNYIADEVEDVKEQIADTERELESEDLKFGNLISELRNKLDNAIDKRESTKTKLTGKIEKLRQKHMDLITEVEDLQTLRR